VSLTLLENLYGYCSIDKLNESKVFDKGYENLKQEHNVKNVSKYLLFLVQVIGYLGFMWKNIIVKLKQQNMYRIT